MLPCEKRVREWEKNERKQMKHVWKSFVGIKSERMAKFFFVVVVVQAAEEGKINSNKNFSLSKKKREKRAKYREKKVNRESYYTFSLFLAFGKGKFIYLHAIISARFFLSFLLLSTSTACLFINFVCSAAFLSILPLTTHAHFLFSLIMSNC